jgi:hypothetical protein
MDRVRRTRGDGALLIAEEYNPNMSAPDAVCQFFDRFKGQLESYRLPKYKEAQVRHEFIDPFFRELGWEIESTDRQIDRLVYELYRLTEDEVKIVEG